MLNEKRKMGKDESKGAPPPKFPLPRDSQMLAQLIYQKAQNIGLLFNKFLWIWDDKWTLEASFEEGKRKRNMKGWFLERVKDAVSEIPRPAYTAFISRQVKSADSLRNHGYQTVIFGKRAEARILSGLGGSHPMEVGFAFHPLYGFPYLPGSGLKGVARSWAELTGQNQSEIKLVFGSESKDERQVGEHQQGSVIFLDAYSITPPPLEVDILNPHFPEYYRDPKNNLPTEWQSPNPVNFLTIGIGKEEKGRPVFQFILAARSSEALHLAQGWLERGLEQLGFGGKTASGYGYFSQGRLPLEEMDKIRDVFSKKETAKPSNLPPSARNEITLKPKRTITTETAPPTAPPLKVHKTEPKSTIRQGDRLEAQVIANDGKRVTIQLVGEFKQEVTFEHPYYPHHIGKKVKVKVISVSSEGKITKVIPA